MTHKTPLTVRLGLVILLWALAAAIGAVGTGGALTAPARAQHRLGAADPLPGRVNYLLGNRREQRQTDVLTYAAILYHDLYPGIDLAYSVAEGRLKSEFRVSPGAIRWQYQGGAAPRIAGDGGLAVAAGYAYVAGGGWQSPVSTGGYLPDGAIAASHGRFFVVGRGRLVGRIGISFRL